MKQTFFAFLFLLQTLPCFAEKNTVCTQIMEDPLVVKIEIAGLMLEKSKAKGDNAAAIKTVLEENISEKLAAYEKAFGEKLNLDELNALAEKLKNGQKEQLLKQARTENIKRSAENRKLQLVNVVFSKKKNENHWDLDYGQLEDDSLPGYDHKPMTGEGLQWSHDDSYVLFRGRHEAATIYDLRNNKALDYRPDNGIMSHEGHLYAEITKYNEKNFYDCYTQIRDLDTGEVFGPVKGRVEPEYFNSNYVITRTPIPGKDLADLYGWYVNYRTGKRVYLGEDFVFSIDRKRIAYVDGDSVKVFSTVKERVEKTFSGKTDGSDVQWGQREGYFTLKRDGRQYLVRLEDLQEFEIPRDYVRAFSGDKIIFSEPRSVGVVIYDLKTKSRHKISTFKEISMSPDLRKVFIYKYDAGGVLVDLDTMAEHRVNLAVKYFSPDGRWLYDRRVDGGSNYKHRLYDIQNQREYTKVMGYGFEFIGSSGRVTGELSRIAKQKTSIIYLGSIENLFLGDGYVEIGEGSVGVSPGGQYIVTIRGKQLVFLKVKP